MSIILSEMSFRLTRWCMKSKEKEYTIKIKKTPNTGHKMERANSTDVRKDLLSQIHIIVY